MERRHFPRLAMACPVKLWCVDTGRFLTGISRDLSAQGALLHVQHSAPLSPGQRLRVGIAWSDRDVLISRQKMLPAVVVRSLGRGPTQYVAISFDATLILPTPTARAA